MFRIKKTFEVAVTHKLNLSYPSKCQNLHGHNLIISIYCTCQNDELDENGMVIDFTHVKKAIYDVIDHNSLSDILCPSCGSCVVSAVGPIDDDPTLSNPTAENLAHWIFMLIDRCYRVDVQESEGNVATYEEDK